MFVFEFRGALLSDPQVLAGRDLEAYGAIWGRRMQRLPGAFLRGDREPDSAYRPRLLELIKSRVEGSNQ